MTDTFAVPSDSADIGIDRPEVTAPPMRGRGVALRRVTPADYDFLYWLATDQETGFRWRFRGTTPSPEEFTRDLWEGVFAQFIVVDTDELPLGVVTSYGAHPRDGYVYLGAAAVPDAIGTGQMVIATVIFIEYLLAVGGFRKIYMESPQFNLVQFGHGLERYCREEARLVEHEWYGDRFWDVVTLAIERAHWKENARRIVRFALGRQPGQDTEAHDDLVGELHSEAGTSEGRADGGGYRARR